jgi:DNA-binding transcriptional MerR regulator
MAELTETDYLSIGEVLGLLLEEFPDVTISKIRFLESQGLIDPERTPSGYRKFYDTDVELLRVILREQRENYLPLRVIKDRLDSGAIDPSGELPKPDNEHLDQQLDQQLDQHDGQSDQHDEPHETEVPASAVAGHPAASRQTPALDETATDEPTADERAAERSAAGEQAAVAPQLLPGVVLDRGELCSMVGLSASELEQLEAYGIVTGRGNGGNAVFGEDAVEIAKISVQFLRAGVDARHLRGWRTAAEREASLFEQLITPRLRQRNPESRAEAVESLKHLQALGGRLRAALVRTALRHHIDG